MLTKSQTVAITLLNIVIVALVAAIFLFPLGGTDGDADVNGPGGTGDAPVVAPPVHEKFRDATNGVCDAIEHETRLMGSGDETIIATYFREGVSYIFGNATVGDLDFDTHGGFVCVVNAAGTIISYDYFGAKITSVGVIDGGFGVGADGLYAVDTTGRKTKKTDDIGTIVDIAALDGGKIGVVTQPASTALKFTEYSASAAGEWTAGRSTRIDSAYSLKFFDCFDFGTSYVIAARAYSTPRYDSLAFYSFTPGGDATGRFYGGTGENIMRPYAVMPCAAGYFALCDRAGLATIIDVDYTFTTYRSVSLGFAFTDARAFFVGGMYYASFARIDGAVTYELDAGLSKRTLTELSGLFVDAMLKTDSGIVAFGTVKNIAAGIVGASSDNSAAEIVALGSGERITLDIKDCAFSACTTVNGKTKAVFTATGGAAVSKPSGGSDVYVAQLRIKN